MKAPDRAKLTDWPVYIAVRIVICIVQALRMETCQSLARLIAFLAVHVLGVRRRVVDDNLRHVFPKLSPAERLRLSRAMWEHLILMACETALAPRKIHRSNWHRHVRIHRKRELVRFLLDPRPTLLVSGHFGNFELGGFVTGLLGFPSYTVARKMDNRFLDAYVNRFRSANGQYIVPKDNSARQIDRLLNRGAVLTLLGDQHAGPKGCWVNFFGRPASCHKAIALFTLTSHAPLLVSYCRRMERPMQFEIGLAACVDPRESADELGGVIPLTQRYNEALEAVIRSAPEQYWWLHRRWKGVPPRLARRVDAKNRAA